LFFVNLIAEGSPLRLALFAICTMAVFAQTPAPLTVPAYDMYRYATVGKAFSYTFVPGGGFGPFRFSVEAGSALPPGLRLDAETGVLAGTVTRTGEFRHIVCISDAARAQICVPFLVIAVANDGETYKELIPARVTSFYENMIELPRTVFSIVEYDPISGQIPAGMVLETTGRLYGIPRAPNGAWAFKVRGRDLDGETITRNYFIRILGPLAATTAMPAGFGATEYSARLTAIGDKPPYVWTVRRGPLPAGYTVSEDGVISGICNFPGEYAFTLRVTDETLASHDRDMILYVDGRPQPMDISNANLPGGSVGVTYRQQVNISGGRPPYAMRALGALPPGLTLSATGLLAGTPTAEGAYTFAVEVRDVAGTFYTKTMQVGIGNLRYTGALTLSLFVSEAANLQLTVSGGTEPYKWAVQTGSLPVGLALSEAGLLSGTPTAAGQAALTLRVSDGGGRILDVPVTVTVGAARPMISANGIVNGASYAGGAIAPGQIITLFGVRMGPPTLAPFVLDPVTRRIPTALAGTRVFVAGLPAPLLYVSGTQIGAIVPYLAGGRPEAEVVVEAAGVRSAAVLAPMGRSGPGLFTADASGKGQAAALNQDGTVNSAGNPVRAGDVVVLFGTGEGQTLPLGVDGGIAGAELPRPTLPVRVTIGGKEAAVLYAGGAPGLVAGVVQVNVRVPADVTGNAVPVVVAVEERVSAAGVTLAIR